MLPHGHSSQAHKARHPAARLLFPPPGLGACMFAGMYEVGRPRRLSVEEAQTLKGQWQDFKRFADARLQRGGRCHESEILRALGRELPRYRAERQLDSNTLRCAVVGGWVCMLGARLEHFTSEAWQRPASCECPASEPQLW